jgi:hypothetical protein
MNKTTLVLTRQGAGCDITRTKGPAALFGRPRAAMLLMLTPEYAIQYQLSERLSPSQQQYDSDILQSSSLTQRSMTVNV